MVTHFWFLLSHGVKEGARVTSTKGQIPLMRTPPSRASPLPEAPPPNTLILGFGVPACEFWKHKPSDHGTNIGSQLTFVLCFLLSLYFLIKTRGWSALFQLECPSCGTESPEVCHSDSRARGGNRLASAELSTAVLRCAWRTAGGARTQLV